MKSILFSRRNHSVIGLIILGIIAAVVLRLFPIAPNFAPIGAIALFGGACLSNKKLAFFLPISMMVLSDTLLHFFSPSWGFHQTMPFVYVSFLIIALLGMLTGEKKNIIRIGSASLAGSILFFLITNFGVWIYFYPQNLQGLVTCYVKALPFLTNTVASDLIFNSILFGSFYLVNSRIPVSQKA